MVAVQLLPWISYDALYFYANYSFEPFNNYLEYGSFETISTAEIAKMYFLPDLKHIVFGAGFVNKPLHGYILPDPGYMKVLLSFGVIGFILFYSLSAVIIYRAYTYLCEFDARYKFMFIIVLVSFFIYEWKEPGLYQNYGFRILILLFALEVVSKAHLSDPHIIE